MAEDLSDEVRIQQSVMTARGMPVLLLGNPAALAVIAWFNWTHFFSSYAVIPAAFLVVLLIPMAMSSARLRHKPRPKRVSERRIRRIVIHSLLMGLAWAATVALLIPSVDAVAQLKILMTMLFLWYGAVALVAFIPKAVFAYAAPAWLATFVAILVDGANDRIFLSIVMLLGLIAVVQTCRQTWLDFRSNVALTLTVVEKNQILESLSTRLSKYLSPQLYMSIFKGEQSVEIASKRKKLTIFFSDIARFTETTDLLEAEELTSLLNQYLTEMSVIASEFGATIDKFIGDAMMLYFGDPETKGVKEDAAACVEMALAMQRRMRTLQTEWRERGLEQGFELRIGINTGFCTVGNFGSKDRMDYTIIGNAVNLAARLQAHADVGGILLANETHSLVRDRVPSEAAETISVKGFAKPIKTFKVKVLHGDLEEQERLASRDQDGLMVTIDRGRLEGNDDAKAKAIRTLEEVLTQLRG